MGLERADEISSFDHDADFQLLQGQGLFGRASSAAEAGLREPCVGLAVPLAFLQQARRPRLEADGVSWSFCFSFSLGVAEEPLVCMRPEERSAHP